MTKNEFSRNEVITSRMYVGVYNCYDVLVRQTTHHQSVSILHIWIVLILINRATSIIITVCELRLYTTMHNYTMCLSKMTY